MLLASCVVASAWSACSSDATPPATATRASATDQAEAGAPRRIEPSSPRSPPRRPGERDSFCSKPAPPRTFEFPPLATGLAPPAGLPLWINVWASWCAPCIIEFPFLANFGERLRRGGIAINITYLSIDLDTGPLDRLRAREPDLPPTLRIRDQAALDAWLPTLGLDPQDTLPLHVFTDEAGEIACVHHGLVREPDFPKIIDMLRNTAAKR